MTLTIKDPPEIASQGKSASTAQNSDGRSGPSPRSNPVCLEVPITIRSLPGDGDGKDRGAAGPIREEGRTVIVFDNGAVLRISNTLPAGQTVILSNQQGRDVVCKVAAGRNIPNIKGYVEVEFIEPVDDFWRIHQSSMPVVTPPAAPGMSIQAVLTSAPPAPPVPAIPSPASLLKPTSVAAQDAPDSAPSFEDIAGLVSMDLRQTVREKPAQLSRTPVPRTPDSSGVKIEPESSPALSPVAPKPEMSVASASVVRTLFAAPAENATHRQAQETRAQETRAQETQAQETPSISDRPQAVSGNVIGRMTMAGMENSSLSTRKLSPSALGGRTALMVGGAALLVVGFGVAFLTMHRSGPSNPPPAAAINQTLSEPLTAASSASNPIPSPVQEQIPQQTQQISTPAPLSAAVDVPVPATSQVDRSQRSANTADSKQPDRTPAKAPAIPNLKLASPKAPGQNLSRSSEAPEIATTFSPVGSAAGTMLSSAGRAENQPAPPPSSAPKAVLGTNASNASDPKLISSTRPVYPEMARQTKIQGKVVVDFSVDTKGNVVDAKAVSGPLLLRQAAVDAVKRWKYSPAVLDGQPTASSTTVSLDFRLN